MTQGAARTIDRKIRMDPDAHLPATGSITEQRIHALVGAACRGVQAGIGREVPGTLHRLDKADTRDGLVSVRSSAELGVPYSMPALRTSSGTPLRRSSRLHQRARRRHRRERHRERSVPRGHQLSQDQARGAPVLDSNQAPDFVIPNEFNPEVVIEAKLTEDDGTARDKVTRVQHLSAP